MHYRIEEATLNAWPALQQMLVDGWIVRFARGYTKRANSVTPLYASHLDAGEKVTSCERLYEAQGLPCIFRIPSFAPQQFDQMLEQRAYRVQDPTLVLLHALADSALPNDQTPALQQHDLDSWLELYDRLSGSSTHKNDAHRAILQAIIPQRMLVSLSQDGTAIACGLGVLEYPYFGLFDLAVAPHMQNKGYGTQLVIAMLHFARNHGATYAYLQVAERNTPARHVYNKLGFQTAYRYWYREQSTAQKLTEAYRATYRT